MKKPVILCVDDEQTILNSLNTQLERKFGDDFELEFAESAEEALELMDELTEEDLEIAMVITDQIMGGMTGDEFLVEVHENYGKTIKVLLTGQAALESAVNAINHANLYRYLVKPWEESDLLLTVEKGLNHYRLIDSLEKQVNVFEKFVPRQFLTRIATEGIENIELGKAQADVITVLFSDIRDFTELSESMENPQDLLNFLNSYLTRMNPAIHLNGGFVDKFIGDAIMALFDQPHFEDTDEAHSAVRAAIGMQETLKVYNGHRKNSGYAPIATGIGIHTGQVIFGTIGSHERMESTVLGDVVNLASRLEGLTKIYNSRIIISSETWRLLEDDGTILSRELDFVRVKGAKKAISIFEIFNSDPEPIRDLKLKILGPFHEGEVNYYNQNWKDALKLFKSCLDIFPEDNVSQMYYERCQKLIDSPPGENWDSSFSLTHK